MIRKLEIRDIDKIMEIWLETSIIAHDFIKKQYWIDNYEAVKNKYIPNSETFLYEENNEIKGFISIMSREFIGALFVSKDFQREGIGSKLIKFAKCNYKVLVLNVYKDNVNAVNFYKKQKFKILSENLDEDTNKVEFTMRYV